MALNGWLRREAQTQNDRRTPHKHTHTHTHTHTQTQKTQSPPTATTQRRLTTHTGVQVLQCPGGGADGPLKLASLEHSQDM